MMIKAGLISEPPSSETSGNKKGLCKRNIDEQTKICAKESIAKADYTHK